MKTILIRVFTKAVDLFKHLLFTILLSHLVGCSNGSMSMNSIGLTSDGLEITFPRQGISKMRTPSSQLKVSGLCSRDYEGVELSFDNSTFIPLATLDSELGVTSDPGIRVISYSIKCAQEGSFELNINDLSKLVAKYLPDMVITDPVSNDITFGVRAFNNRSTSLVKSVKITPAPLVLSALYLVSPLTSPGNDSTPTVEAADDLALGDSVTLYYDANCTTPASFTYPFLAGERLTFDIYQLTDSVDNEFYAK